MLTVFNRRELTVTFDLKRQAELSALLEKAGVAFAVRTVGRGGACAGGRGRVGSFGEDPRYACEYVFYVRRRDYARARAAMDGRID